MDGLIRKKFVRDVLLQEAKRYDASQLTALQKKLTFHTGNLVSSRKFTVTGGDHLDGMLSFRHAAYQRFLDMSRRVFRKTLHTVKKGEHKGEKRMVRSTGFAHKKSYGIHNRYAFGYRTAIIRHLLSGLTEDVSAGIRAQLTNGL